MTDLLQASTAATLLRHYMWNSEKLQEQFWNDPASALAEAGLSPPSSPSTLTQPLPSPSDPSPAYRRSTRSLQTAYISPPKRTRSVAAGGPFECPVCCDEYPKDQVQENTLALGCGHRFCRLCWTEYLSGKIKGDGESARVQCMESGCKRIVREEVVEEVLSRELSKLSVWLFWEA